MTSPIPVTRGEARRFMLWYQGLLGPRKGDVMNWVGRLGAVQFDPLNPFMRSAELTLAARVYAGLIVHRGSRVKWREVFSMAKGGAAR